jgi:hypothetical protein
MAISVTYQYRAKYKHLKIPASVTSGIVENKKSWSNNSSNTIDGLTEVDWKLRVFRRTADYAC